MRSQLQQAFRSMARIWIEVGPDPSLLLKHLLQDLEALLPPVDQQLEAMAASIRLLVEEIDGQNRREAGLVLELRRCLEEDREDKALELAGTLDLLRSARRTNLMQRRLLASCYESTLGTKRELLTRLQSRAREVAQSLPPGAHEESRRRISEAVSEFRKAQNSSEFESELQSWKAASLEDAECLESQAPRADPEKAQEGPDLARRRALVESLRKRSAPTP